MKRHHSDPVADLFVFGVLIVAVLLVAFGGPMLLAGWLRWMAWLGFSL